MRRAQEVGRWYMALPVKLMLSVEIHRAVFFEIPLAEVQNPSYGSGRGLPVVDGAAGRSEEQERHHKDEQYYGQERFHIRVRPSQIKGVTEQVPSSSIELRPRFPKRLPRL
jgi:hypothetical protein